MSDVLRPTAAPGCGGTPRSPFSFGSPMSSTIRSGRNASASSTPSSPSWAVRISLPMTVSSIARLAAPSRLSSTTRIRRLEPALPSAASAARRSGVRLARATGQPHDERAALPVPVAPGLDRAAVHLDQPLHQRQPDAQPALHRSRLGPPARTSRKTSAAPRPECRCPCPARSRPPRRRAARRSGQIRPPGSVYLALLLSRLPEHLGQPGQVGVEVHGLRRQRRPSASWPLASICGRAVSTALLTTCRTARSAPCAVPSCCG